MRSDADIQNRTVKPSHASALQVHQHVADSRAASLAVEVASVALATAAACTVAACTAAVCMVEEVAWACKEVAVDVRSSFPTFVLTSMLGEHD